MKELWHSAWIGLRRRRLRTLLTAVSIGIGTALVVLIAGVGAVGEQAIRGELESMGINGLSVSASEGLTQPCLSSIRRLPMVKQAMPLMIKYGAVDVGSEIYNTVSCGIDAGADQVISLQLLHGRLLSAGDVAAGAPVCVLDEALALAAFGRSDVTGSRISVVLESATMELEVVGVTATGSSLLQTVTAMIPYMLYTPYSTLQAAVGEETFDQIAVRVSSPEETAAVQAAIERVLSGLPESVGTLMTENLAAQRERLDRMVAILSLALTAIGGVSLVVSGFGIMTVMLSVVHERTREIGVKKAIGATRGRILAEFLAGAFLLSLEGALAGLLCGMGIYAAGCFALHTVPVWPWGKLVGVLLLTLTLGTVCGLYPAYQAAGLRPVDALRRQE